MNSSQWAGANLFGAGGVGGPTLGLNLQVYRYYARTNCNMYKKWGVYSMVKHNLVLT
jgi:hypothetical protein